MELKSIVLYDDNNVENYLEGNILCYEDGFMEGIMVADQDMYISGKKEGIDEICFTLLTPSNYPYVYEYYTAYQSTKNGSYEVICYDNEGNCDGMCSMRLLSKKVSREIKDAEIEELKFRMELYKETYQERLNFYAKCSDNMEQNRKQEEALRGEQKIHYYL